jgi:hypothetical protein
MLWTTVRGALVLLAALVVAWSVVSHRAVGQEERARELATRVAFGNVPARQIDEALADVRSAGRYRADRGPLIAEGALLYAAGRRTEAAEIARRAIDEEPDNVEAWFLAYSSAGDEQGRAAAKREVARLNPWAADDLP